MKLRRTFSKVAGWGWVVAAAIGVVPGVWSAARAAEPARVVLIAGPKSHGPEGNRIHDYPWSVRLLKTLLENSNVRERLDVHTELNGWPAESSSLEAAATVMIVSDGRDGDNGREALHLASPERVAQVERLMRRGCGIVVFHFSTFAPDALAERALEWQGGYFDWETDGKREWYSKIATLEAMIEPAAAGHPVLEGVGSFSMREEFYFDIRFRPDDPRWTPIWSVPDLPATRPHGRVVAWAVERADGGRGFATTCGHFYDNWAHAEFRKTLLNAIAWTARIAVPPGGVEAPYFSRQDVALHLGDPGLAPAEAQSADATVYADEPYWYKPGHPLLPANSAGIATRPGFAVEQVLAVPREWGSWTALAVDPRGRLLAAAQHEPGIYRIDLESSTAGAGGPRVEKLGGAAAGLGWAHGLVCAFDSLYVTVSEKGGSARTGVHRLRDTDGDDQYDEAALILALDGAGEHGPHQIVPGPDGASLYMMCGNGTKLPGEIRLRRPAATEGIDRLMPPGFRSSNYSVQGFVIRFQPDGSGRELHCAGLRNSYDLAFNREGELFTWDSDMEWDLGTPWYRPTRVCHLASGAEFGWRGDSAIWPDYLEDGAAPVVNVGPGSPTGVVFGYGTRFPTRYQNALYVCDWTFATIHAVHLHPDGAGYRGEIEEFVSGRGLPLTDIVVGRDGGLYFSVGGRRLGSAIYRVSYSGADAGGAAGPRVLEQAPKSAAEELRWLRRELEVLHGRPDSGAIARIWEHLGHADRSIRLAARVALEANPVDSWRARALAEADADRASSALLALARQGAAVDAALVLRRLCEWDWSHLTAAQRLTLVRAAELALARGGGEAEPDCARLRERLRGLFPGPDAAFNRELARLLAYLGDATILDPALGLMEADAGERPRLGTGYFMRNPKYGAAVRDMLEAAPRVERMHYGATLLWLKSGWSDVQRRRYFELLAEAVAASKGGHQYRDFWARIRELALRTVPSESREALASIGARTGPAMDIEGMPVAAGPGREWTLEGALQAADRVHRGRNYANGRKMYAAAGCALCHRFNGEGGAVGPDLSAIGRRFTVRDLLEAVIHPSNAISDQYQMVLIELADGRTLSGRLAARDDRSVRLAPDLLRPFETIEIRNGSIRSARPVPVSTMPSGLLNALSEEEMLDLLAYLIAAGEPNAAAFAR